MSAPSSRMSDFLSRHLTAEDYKLCMTMFPKNGIMTMDDVERLSKDDLKEMGCTIGQRNRWMEVFDRHWERTKPLSASNSDSDSDSPPVSNKPRRHRPVLKPKHRQFQLPVNFPPGVK